MAEMIKSCKVCGKEFITTCHNKAYCSEECSVDGKRADDRMRRLKRKKKSNSLVEIAVEARKHGMTYGQYVAWKGI